MDDPPIPECARPSRELSRQQADWLRGGRTRLLRAAQIVRRRHILDVGAGWGDVPYELAERSSARITALDGLAPPMEQAIERYSAVETPRVQWLQARAESIPLADASCDLIFTQCAWLWFAKPDRVVAEMLRVVTSDGAMAFIEPDYGAMIEYPDEISTRALWQDALMRAGADPCIGRKLPRWLAAEGLEVTVFLADRLEAPSPQRFDFLRELPLTLEQRGTVDRIEALEQTLKPRPIVHLPFAFILATFPRSAAPTGSVRGKI